MLFFKNWKIKMALVWNVLDSLYKKIIILFANCIQSNAYLSSYHSFNGMTSYLISSWIGNMTTDNRFLPRYLFKCNSADDFFLENFSKFLDFSCFSLMFSNVYTFLINFPLFWETLILIIYLCCLWRKNIQVNRAIHTVSKIFLYVRVICL